MKAVEAISAMDAQINRYDSSLLAHMSDKLEDNGWLLNKTSSFGLKADDPILRRKLIYIAAVECGIEYFEGQKRINDCANIWDLLPPIDFLNLLYCWQSSPVILEYDNDLVEALEATIIDSTVSLNRSLKRMPYNCFFIDVDKFDLRFADRDWKPKKIKGLFVFDSWSAPRKESHKLLKTLTVVPLRENGHLTPLMLPIYLDSIEDMVKEVSAQYQALLGVPNSSIKKSLEQDIERIIKLLLYIVSERPDMEEIDTKLLQTKKPKLFGSKQFSEKIAVFSIGSNRARCKTYDMAEENDPFKVKKAMKPHIRRAHFHTYLVGSKVNGEQQRILRWVEQTQVNMKDSDTEPMFKLVQKK